MNGAGPTDTASWLRSGGFLYGALLFVVALLALAVAAPSSALDAGERSRVGFFLAFALFTISIGYEQPAFGYVSFDRVAQVSSILVLGPVDAAWINGFASLVYPWHRLRKGVPPFATVNPADGETVATVSSAGEADVDRAVAAARRALESGPWARMSAADRGKILWKMGERILEESGRLALLETLDTGKTLFDSGKIEIPMAAQIFQFYAGAATKIGGRTIPSRPDAFQFTLKEPVGVVAAITPWNFPFLLASWKVAPALAAGCTVILKPASQTPLTALEMGRIGLECGLPPGVLQVLPGSGAVAGMALVRHAGVDKVSFTGSVEVGRTVVRDVGRSN